MANTVNQLVFELLDWVKHNPVGTQIEYTEDDGSVTVTYTRSDPWVLPNGKPVLLIIGRSGCVAFDRCHPVHQG